MGFFASTHCSLLASSAAELNVVACLDPENARDPGMCRCIYCTDVYVGPLCLRVIYLPKDHDVDSGKFQVNIYWKYVAFFLCLSWRLWTNTEFYGFLFLFFLNQCNIIVSIKSWAEPLSQQGGAQATTRYDRQARRSPETTACSSLSHFMTTICIPDTVDLPCLFATVGCWAFYTTYCTYFSKPQYFTRRRRRKKKPLKRDWRLQVFQSAGAWKKTQLYLISSCMSSSQIGTT